MAVTDTLQLETIKLEHPASGVLLVTLDRPDRLNAQTDGMFRELEQLALSLRDRTDLRAVVLTGSGRAFCAGFDLDEAKQLAEVGAMEMLRRQELAARAMVAMRTIPLPVIAAVNGPASGGGMALALTADIRIGVPAAKFNCAFVKIGLSMGDLGTSWLLPRLIGPGRAAEVGYTGRFIEAEEAERLGLLNRVVAPEDLLDAALEVAAQIAANSPGGVRMSKRALQANMEAGSYAAALELENRGQALLTRAPDMPEALAAFRERRAPSFRGE
jgi:enoyl-CoA hydratase/carnithine racemase